jgi:hypothetical protein
MQFVYGVPSTLISLFVGFYLAGYLREKGKNLATHEDIVKVLDQVRAVTTTTKEIEAKISNDVWDRQKRWELKRDLSFEFAKTVAGAKDVISNVYAVYNTDKTLTTEKRDARLENRNRVMTKYNEAISRLDDAFLRISLV